MRVKNPGCLAATAVLYIGGTTACGSRVVTSDAGDTGSTSGFAETSSVTTAGEDPNDTTGHADASGPESTGAAATTWTTDLTTSMQTTVDATMGGTGSASTSAASESTSDSNGSTTLSTESESTSGFVSTTSESSAEASGSSSTSTGSSDTSPPTSSTEGTESTDGSSSSGDSSGDTTGGPACGDNALVDQSNLVSSGNLGVLAYQSPGQTFRVSVPGTLSGFELPLLRCDLTDDQVASFALSDESLSLLATVEVLAVDLPLPGWCGIVPDPLELELVTGTFVDFSPHCIHLEPDVEYRLELAVIGDGICGGDFSCEGTGQNCVSDEDCQDNGYRVGSADDDYANGTLLINGAAWALDDLSFKVFISAD